MTALSTFIFCRMPTIGQEEIKSKLSLSQECFNSLVGFILSDPEGKIVEVGEAEEDPT